VGEMDLNEFFRQARDYDASAQGLDSLLKFLDIVADTHPLSSIRMVALQEWEKSGRYASILSGEYERRGESSSDQGPDLAQKLKEARDSYAQDFSSSQDPLSQAAGKVMDALGGVFGQARRPMEGKGTGSQDGDSGAARGAGPKSVEELFDDIFGKKRPL